MAGVIWHYWILSFDGECIFITPQILLPNDAFACFGNELFSLSIFKAD
jgi:hypothetical protein